MLNKVMLFILFMLFSIPLVESKHPLINIKLIDLDKIYSSLKSVKDARTKIQGEMQAMQRSMKAKYDEFNRLIKALENAGSTISAEDKKKKEQKIINLRDSIAREQSQMQPKIAKRQMELMKPIEDKLYKEASKLAKSLNIPLILGYSKMGGVKVLYSKSELDITNTFLKNLKK